MRVHPGADHVGRLLAFTVLAAVSAWLPACAARRPARVEAPAGNRPSAPASTPVPAATGAPAAAAAAATPRPPAPAPLVGHVARINLEEYVTWRTLRAQDYAPDAAAVRNIAARAAKVEVLAIVATWCSDSKREVPRFFKIADQALLPMERVMLIAVDRTKKDAGGLTDKHAITRVPTFVFFRAGQEIGRITERPKTTLENDIAEILTR